MLAVGGENLIDMVEVSQLNGFPQYSAIPGGSPYNVAIAAARQATPTLYLTPISNDAVGTLLADRLEKSGAKLAVKRSIFPTSLALVSLQNGVPSYSFYRENTAERRIDAQEILAAIEGKISWFHIGSLALAGIEDGLAWEKIALESKANGVGISLDPNIRSKLIPDEKIYRKRLNLMFEIADVVKLSDEDLAWIYPEMETNDALNRLLATTKAKLIVLTKGGEGCQYFHEGNWHNIPASPVRILKDTVGAGDTFMASILADIHENYSLEKIAALSLKAKEDLLKRAGRAAAINCERQGCNPPTKEELEKWGSA